MVGFSLFSLRHRTFAARHYRSVRQVTSSTLSSEEHTKLEGALKLEHMRVKLYQPTASVTADLEFQENSHSRTIVLLAGWVHSTLKALDKYASMCTNEFHLPCLSVAPPIQLVWSTWLGKSFANRILQALQQSLDDTPTSLVLYMFSAAGNVLFPRLMEESMDPESLLNTKLKLRGVIFDSGPVLYSCESARKGAHLLYFQGKLNLLSYSFYSGIGIPLSETLVGKKKRRELYNALESDLLDIPQLYLYSKKDPVSPHEWVSEVVRRQRETYSQCWENSEHVLHLKQHTKQYTEVVKAFLKNC